MHEEKEVDGVGKRGGAGALIGVALSPVKGAAAKRRVGERQAVRHYNGTVKVDLRTESGLAEPIPCGLVVLFAEPIPLASLQKRFWRHNRFFSTFGSRLSIKSDREGTREFEAALFGGGRGVHLRLSIGICLKRAMHQDCA